MAETVLITGASAGFGKAMTETFIHSGYRVIGAARRLEKLGKLREALGEHFYPLQLDMTDTSSINKALANLPKEWSKIELLVNNAGLALGLDKAYEANFKDWETMIATNIIGLTYLTRQILPDMVARKSGHIINIGSTAGTYPYPGGNVYGASKAFVKQFSLNLRADLAGTKVRVTNIEPGLCGSTESRPFVSKEIRSVLNSYMKVLTAFSRKILPMLFSGLFNNLNTLISIVLKLCQHRKVSVLSQLKGTIRKLNIL